MFLAIGVGADPLRPFTTGGATTDPASGAGSRRGAPSGAAPEVVAGDLEVPWGLAFLPTGEAVVTEREGRLNVIPATGSAQRNTIQVPGVVQRGEGGLLGVAVSPGYATDRWIYAYMTTSSDNRVVRFRIALDNRSLVDSEVVVDGIDAAGFHNGGRIAFGPDAMLYVATGDAGSTRSSQDLTDLNGKILRMTPDGEPAPGNPVRGSVVYSSGHRNVQGLAGTAPVASTPPSSATTPSTRSTSSTAARTTAGPSSKARTTRTERASPTRS